MFALLATYIVGTSCLSSPAESGATSTHMIAHSPQIGTAHVLHVGNRDDREALYKQGISYDEFLASAQRRKDRWHNNSENSEVDEDLLRRARAVKGSWKLLAVAVDGCSDSVSTIPYLAALESVVDGLEMRIIDSTVGRPIMMDHLTADGREATPTIVLLNDAYKEVGCFIERPAVLQDWVSENRADLSSKEYLEQKFAWYDEDAGRQTVEAIVSMMEDAAAGKVGC